MFNTDFYNQGRSFKSGMEQGQGLRGAFNAVTQPSNQDVGAALKAIQGGADPKMIIAELQKTNPAGAAEIQRMLGWNTGAPSMANSFSLNAPRL